MDKLTFSATYQGECYINGYGRKLYKRGVKLTDVKDSKGSIISCQMYVNFSKTFLKSNLICGERIEFQAVHTDDNRILYISNIKVI